MIPCPYCKDGSNAEFDGWEIVEHEGLEALCSRFVCKQCGTPTWVLEGVREADDHSDDDDDDHQPLDISAGWEA